MLLGPIKALYNINYYVERLKKSGWSALFFILYLFVIASVFIAITTPAMLKTTTSEIIEKVAAYTPDIIIQEGIATVNGDQTLTVTPPELGGYKIVFNTGKLDPVYPTELETSNTLILLTADTMYASYNGQFQENPLPQELTVTITPETILQNKDKLTDLIGYSLTAMVVLAQFIKIPFMLILGLIVTAIINIYARTGVKADQLLKLSCYLQAPITLLFMLNYVSPVKIPFMAFVYFIVLAAYSYFIFTKIAISQAAGAAKKINQNDSSN